ncbi:LysR family transcriptional regulator [Chromobacterium violaceum]|uniref:LysR family transcriptional regulator n=1 Tax=Chromobacterium violaceum TaxID=536 RepID=A0A202BDH6_CHRVL|nr:LysR family transcriptional regulator [Chromobacterium violaceum]MBP4046428.1 LysR family transcriptional regulator [Chromobacterium violaceum]OVE49528.1 LysR family transcriptional regulator [Chromobacterium violaceum]
MSKIPQEALQAFCAIARHRSFTRAGAELGVSASALSQTMRQLEASLGVPLLTRTTRQVAPTEAGEALLARLAPALDEIRAALDEAGQAQGQPVGRLRVTLPHTAAQLLFYPALADFAARHSRLRLELDVNNGLVDIVAQRFDAGVRFGEALQPGMQALPVSRPLRFVVAAAPDYLSRRGAPQHPEDLVGHACLGYRFGGGQHYRWQFVRDGLPLQLAVDGPLIANDNTAMLHAALGGAGLAYLAEPLIEPWVAAGRLAVVLDGYAPPAEALYLYYPHRPQQPAKLRALIAFLRERAGLPQA